MRTFAFIDASNLFYGGEKSLGWKVDYQKLAAYLQSRYGVSRILYFGGIEINGFKYDYIRNETVPLDGLKHTAQIKFYQTLEKIGYELHLKPTKIHKQEDGTVRKKANCDVEMALYLITQREYFDRTLVLSGDGDFLPVLKYLRTIGKEIVILAPAQRTAREIKKIAGDDFKDFTRLGDLIKVNGAYPELG